MQIHVTIPDERADEINAQLAEEARLRGLDLERYLTEKLVGAGVTEQSAAYNASEAVDRIRMLRRGNVLGGASVKEFIEEGRRY
jgi:hypothetical protein